MVFTVSIEPWHSIHGTSPEGVQRIFEELAEFGVGGIAIRRESVDEPGWPEYADAVAKCADDFDFRISCHAPFKLDASSVVEDLRKTAVEQSAQLIRAVGTHMSGVVYTVHPENGDPVRVPGDDEARIENCREGLKTLIEVVTPFDGRLAIENMRSREDNSNRTGMYTDQLTQIIDGLDPAVVGICFDTGHANISEKVTVAKAFEQNAKRIIHVHYDDNRGIDDEHLLPGEGNIDFEAFFQAVRKSGYSEMIELEVKLPEGMDARELCRRSIEYYQNVGGTL